MYIKQIIIQGFKSYKEQTVMEPFSPKTNVVVGRNGSGKSNFFAAIRFVLGDMYTQMGREERQGLLHEGSGSAVTQAYVEIIFDNSDGRFTTANNNEVVIRRTIGLKKDEYSLDRKVVQKSEINSLLEGAGFSKSNPYYIVPQGRVTALTNMKETERLNLLKEIAGTNTYESRRVESLKIMNETTNKRDKIDELLEYINQRLSELEEEKEELRGFQEKDKERRCLEYAYYHRQQTKVTAQLNEIEDARQGNGASKQEQDAFSKGEQELQALDQLLRDLDQNLELLTIDRGRTDSDRKAASRAAATSEMKVKTLNATRESRDTEQQNQEAELAEIRKRIKEQKAALAKIVPELERWRSEEADVKRELDLAEAGRRKLSTKQSRGSQFKSRKERDAWLQEQISETTEAIAKQKAVGMDATDRVNTVQKSISQLEQEIQELRDRKSRYGDDRAKLREDYEKADEELGRLDEKRKQLWREREKLQSVRSKTETDMHKAEGDLRGFMDFSVFKGLQSLTRLKKEQDIPGAYGYLAELMDLPPEAYRVAIEQVGGGSLFHYVVDNDETSTYMGQYLRDKAAGRITFMPLSRLHEKRVNLPRAADAQPLLSKIEYDPEYEKAFQHVFGRSVVCPDLRTAGQYALSHNVEGVTIEGDRTHKAGAVTGGYIDNRKSRLKAVHKAKELRELFEEQSEQLAALDKELDVLNQEITHARGEKDKLEQALNQFSAGFQSLSNELRLKESQLDSQISSLEKAKQRLAQVEENLKNFDENVTAWQTEMATEFKKALSANEEHQLELMTEEVRQLKQKWTEVIKKRRELDGDKQLIEIDLRQNLQPQEDLLSSQAFEAFASGLASSDQEAQKELKKARKALQGYEAELDEIDRKINETNAKKKKLEAKKTEKEQVQQELARHIEKQQQRIEKNVRRKALLQEQVAEFTKNIRDLGLLPEEAFGKYEKLKPEQIESRIKKVNEALKKYKHINKKAFEQYTQFTSQQEQLLKRRKELDDAQGSIEELIEHLDRCKDEAIERTFKQVSREFTQIFEQLVPAGHGRLVIQRRTDRDRNRNGEESDDEPRGSVESYTGVGISVSFNSKTLDEQQKIQQLSGGQKSLCALCLIFAIQATETSPMVIFDEVDANLDAQYRTAVASLLKSTSENAGTQFICTTFRPEIVHIADKCYGVTFHNKTSTIDCVPTEEALNFVEGQQTGKR